MKTNLTMWAFLAVTILLAFSVFGYLGMKERYEDECQRNEFLVEQQIQLSESIGSLSASFEEISKQKNYSISLSPNINTKLNSTFGATKNMTFQYFFTMDGNKIELKPDSTLTLIKKE